MTGPPLTASRAAINSGVKVYGDCQTPSVEPQQIVLACADVGDVVQNLFWETWTAKTAIGDGTWVYKDCKPDCATGHFHSLPTRIAISNPVRDPNGQLVFSELKANPLPPGRTGPQSLPTRPD